MRSTQAMNAARQSQFLAGDIRRAGQYAEIDRQRLNLQERQLEISKQNQALQWAQFGIEAVGKICGLIDSIGNQKIMDMNAEYKNALLEAGQEAANTGAAGFRMGEGGKLEYSGLGDIQAVKDIRAAFDERVKKELGGFKGRAAKALDNTLMDVENATRRTAWNMVEPMLYKQFEGTMSNAVDQAIVHYDESLIKQALSEAGNWMPEIRREWYAQQASEQVQKGRIENMALAEAKANGVGAMEAYLESVNVRKPVFEITQEQVEGAKAAGREIPQQDIIDSKAKASESAKQFNPNFTQEDIQRIINKGQAASTNAAQAAASSAANAFDEARKKGATWQDAASAAVPDSANPEVRDKAFKVINDKLFTGLHNEWSMKLTEARSEEEFNNLKDQLKNSVGNFKGNEVLYSKLMDEINSEITKAQRTAKTGDESDFLKNRFGLELAGSANMSLDELKSLRKAYESRKGEYEKNGMLYMEHLDHIDDEIARKQKAAGGGGGASGTGSVHMTQADTIRLAEMFFEDWQKDTRTGPAVEEKLNKLFGLPLETKQKMLYRMRAGDDGQYTQTAEALARFDGLTNDKYEKLKDKKTGNDTMESLDYKEHAAELRKQIGMMRYSGKVKPENMMAYVEDMMKLEEAKMLDEAGAFTSKGLVQAREFSQHRGFDPVEYTTYDDDGKSRQVSIRKYKEMFTQYVKQEEEVVERSLKGTGWEMVGPTFEKNDEGDNKGEVAFKLRHKDGREATARVGMDGKLEKKEAAESTHVDGKLVTRDGGWVPFAAAAESGRLGTAKGVAERLDKNQITKIDAAVKSAESKLADERRPPKAVLEALDKDIKKIMGNMGETYDGKAYIAERIKELEKRYLNSNWTSGR
jgi:hypothetical protein